ncbi:MAG: cyclic nucleotide-binding domain-containing protein [Polyangiaceae bacterium]|nr:cyclic nucleotide-binding domain-containing protein [Polyangiaceae bacterium]
MIRPLADPPSQSLHRILRRTDVFSELSNTEIQALSAELEWMSLPADETLFQKGDAGDSLFITVSGRLEAFDPEAPPEQRVWGRVMPGELVGEMAILTGDPRRATVRALRDSVLLRLTKARFLQLVERNPRMLLSLSRLLLERIEEATSLERKAPLRPLIALAPITRGARVDALARRLSTELATFGPTLAVHAADVMDAIGVDVAEAELGTAAHQKLVRWLQDEESRREAILLLADAENTPWTRFCIRQADSVLLVADVRDMPGGTGASDLLQRHGRSATGDRRELVLVHPDATKLPRGTRRWLDAFPVDSHHHVRLGERADIRRLSRYLTGRAVALALSGGAARGFAHVGVIRAFEETGIPVDLVCGTSMGALFGGLLALGWSYGQIAEAGHEAFVKSSIFDITLPLVSALSGKRLEQFLERCFGDAQIEDLWLRYFCMACNLSSAVPVRIRRGSAGKAIRSSSSVPGLFAPVNRDGQLLVDGLFLNNLPAELAKKEARGRTVAVNVIQAADPKLWSPLARGGGPVSQAARMINPFKGQWVPPIMELVMQCFFLSTIHASERVRKMVDLYIEPRMERFGFLEAKAFDEAALAGYEAAKPQLEEWLRSDPEVARL